jgi:hypothetical protein
MTLLNKFFIDSFTYFNKKGLSISDALKVTDIFLLQLDIDINEEAAFNSYMDDFIELNKLLYNYFTLATEEAGLLDSSKYASCKTLLVKDKKIAIDRIKSRRLALYKKYTPDLVKLVADFKSEVNIKAA